MIQLLSCPFCNGEPIRQKSGIRCSRCSVFMSNKEGYNIISFDRVAALWNRRGNINNLIMDVVPSEKKIFSTPGSGIRNEKLATILNKKHIPKAKLALMTGLSIGTITSFACGWRKPTSEIATKIEQSLCCKGLFE